MTEGKIILIEEKQGDRQSLFFSLQNKGFNVEPVRNGAGAIRKIEKGSVSLVILDAASLQTNGSRIVNSIKKNYPSLPLILLVENEPNPNVEKVADFVLRYPLTEKKVINRIKLIMTKEPGPNAISAGPLVFDPDTRVVFIKGAMKKLTPKLANMLRYFLEHLGEPVTADELYRAVWHKEPGDDKRTLDVHIRWLRDIIEENPNEPKNLLTMRGVGYLMAF